MVSGNFFRYKEKWKEYFEVVILALPRYDIWYVLTVQTHLILCNKFNYLICLVLFIWIYILSFALFFFFHFSFSLFFQNSMSMNKPSRPESRAPRHFRDASPSSIWARSWKYVVAVRTLFCHSVLHPSEVLDRITFFFARLWRRRRHLVCSWAPSLFIIHSRFTRGPIVIWALGLLPRKDDPALSNNNLLCFDRW